MSLFGDFKAFSPGRQVLFVGLAVALLGAILFAVYFAFLREDYSTLFANLRTMDAATIIAELDKKKIPYRLKEGGATILVPTDQVDTTRLNVMSEDLPIKGTVGFELFNKSDMGLTEFAQKINYQRALQGELARTIMTMDAIDAARVHLSLPEPTIFRADRRPPKASVTLVTRAGKKLSTATVLGIRRLVASAVPDLDLANVVILDDLGEVVSNDNPTAATMSSGAQAQHAVEEYYAARVRGALDHDYPDAGVEVTILPGLDAATHEESYAALQAWTPGNRRFRLGVAVSVATVLTQEVELEVRNIAGAAVGLDAARGDVLTVSPAGPESVLSALPAPIAAPAAPPIAALAVPGSPGHSLGSVFGFWMTLTAVLLVPLLIVAAYLARRRVGARRSLTAQQRLDYTDKLRVLLEKGEANAASSV